MKSVTLTVVIVVVMLMAIACMKDNGDAGKSAPPGASPATTATATPDEFASVRPIFKKHCEECHGPTGDGGPVTVNGKKLRVPSLKADHALKHKDEDYVDQIMNGGDGMPVFKDKLQPAEIDGLVKFIRKEFQKK